VLAFFFLVGRIYGRRTALIGSLMLATTPFYYLVARQFMFDMPFVAINTAALLCLVLGAIPPPGKDEEPHRRRYLAAMWVLIGLGLLTKGALSIAVPGAIGMVYVLITFDWRIIKRLEPWWGVPVMLAVAAPWFIYMTHVHGEPFLRAFFYEHHIERLAGELNLSRSLVFASVAMSRLAVLVQRLGPRDVTVLLVGESGTGKERVAEAIVRASSRRERPFVRFNCASLGPELAEAELFGHSKGAFTGAHRARPGLFREADGGTVLLDEVGELDPTVQARLLRVLQEGEVRPVGADTPVKVDVRVIAATNRDLRQMVEQGTFREDLFYRLAVVVLRVPPLRERPEDIPVLARHFLDIYADRFGADPLRVPADLTARLATLSWPGNVRELENTVEMLVALSVGGEIDAGLLPGPEGPSEGGLGLKERMDACERGLMVEALRQAHGNRSEAARALGISRVTLYDKLRKHGLDDGG